MVHSQSPGDEPEDILASDLLAITTVFVASHHGKRANKKRKRQQSTREEKKENNEIESKEKIQESC